MSLHQANKDKPRALKCRHFCFNFDLHNYCPTCRQAGKGDDPCVTFETPCQVCTSFSDEQLKKIQNRKRYLKKQKAETSSKDDELDNNKTSRVLLITFLPHHPTPPPPPPPPTPTPTPPPPPPTPPTPTHPPSSTSRLQFIVFKDPSQVCSTHPRYSFAK